MKLFNKKTLIIIFLSLLIGLIIFIHWEDFKSKTIWDWLTLLIIPLSVGVGALYFQHIQKKREIKQSEANTEKKLRIVNEQHLVSNYKYFFDKMLDFILMPDFDKSKKIILAIQVLTLSSFRKFDGTRKAEALDFLNEAKLLDKIKLNGLNLDDAVIKNSEFFKLDFSKSRFHNLTLLSSNFKYSKLNNCRFLNSNLTGMNLQNCDLTNVIFEKTILKGSLFQHKANRKKEISYIKFYMYGTSFIETKTQKSLFNSLHFKGGLFKLSNLTTVSFKYCKFEKVSFHQSIMDCVEFINCKFYDCNFKESSLSGAVFNNVVFVNIEMDYLDLSNIDFSLTTFRNSTFTNVLYNKNTIWKNDEISKDCILTNMRTSKINQGIYKINNEPYINNPQQKI